MVDKVTGPASYFPSIEKTYGHPISSWMTQLDAVVHVCWHDRGL